MATSPPPGRKGRDGWFNGGEVLEREEVFVEEPVATEAPAANN